MPAQINAYIGFSGNCKEAMTFYQQCLGGSLSLVTVGESAMADQMPDAKDQIMHAMLVREGLVMLMGSDMAKEQIVSGNIINLMLNCSSDEEINTFFSKLSEGGVATQAPKLESWGDIFGHLTDKFGINWMLNYNKNAN